MYNLSQEKIAHIVAKARVAHTAPLQNSEVKDSKTSVRMLRFQHQRCVFVTTAAKLCTEPRNRIGIANKASQQSSGDKMDTELTDQVR